MSVIVYQLEGRNFTPSIKWVNDVLVDGKKLCGILTEAAIEGETGAVDYAVVGIGLNLHFDPEQAPTLTNIATGLSAYNDSVPRRSMLIAEILNYLEENLHLLNTENWREWKSVE